jgi:hypothetical protein
VDDAMRDGLDIGRCIRERVDDTALVAVDGV